MQGIFSVKLRLLFSTLILLMAAGIASAQFKAALQGTVTDSSGGLVADATVTLTNKETGQTQTATTSSEGFYRFSGLAPGLYSVSAEKANFKKGIVDDLRIAAEVLQGVDIVLTAGVISETVTVTAESAGIETEDANIRKNITTDEILKLPQTGRDPYELARLSPGVFGTGSRGGNGNSVGLPNTSGPGGSNNSIFATENVQPISANGQRVSSNNYEIDGTSVNSQTWGGGAVITPSQESVKEVTVTSSTYSAEDGRNSGAQIKVVSQNGTNNWHGSAFFKGNEPGMNAFNKMPRQIGTLTTNGPERVNRKFGTFGGSFGGPIVKNRLFFFGTYEGLRESTTGSYISVMETAGFRSAVIAARPGGVTARLLGSAGVEPRVLSILPATCSGIFTPNCAVVGDGMDIGRLTGATGTYAPTFTAFPALDGVADLQHVLLESFSKFRGHQFNGRIDFQATDKDKFTFSSYVTPVSATTSDSNAQSRPQADVTSDRLNYLLGFVYARTISSNIYNEARFNLTRWGFDETKSNPNADLSLPRVEVEGMFSNRLRFGFPQGLNTPGLINEKQFDIRDTLSWIAGNHVLKFGGVYRRDLNSNGEVGGARPLYSMHTIWNLANGTPIFEFVAATLNGKPSANNTKFSTGELAAFVQDDWKFRPNLTLNLGVRWSYFAPPTASDGVLGNLIPSSNGLAGATIATDKTLYNKDYNNFGPQLGFAWNPSWADKKLVIRGGAGMGFDRLPNALLANSRRNPPNGALFNICCGTEPASFGTPFVGGQIAYVASSDSTIFGYPANPLLGGGTNPATGLPNSGSVEIYGAPRDLPTAYVMRYSLEGQYELPGNMVATLGYQGSQGRHFVRILPLHTMSPTNNPRISAAYFASPDVNSSYNALISRLQGRLARQFSFDANYRFAKSIDTASFEAPCACTNQSFPVDQKEERGPSDFDVKHAFTMSGTWEIPGFDTAWGRQLTSGWSLSGIATWNSGFPWTPKLFGCLQGVTSSSANFCDPRPTSYNGAQPGENSNDNFLRPGGIFGASGTSIFGTAFNTSNPFQNRPAIGRNALRGPRYFSVDMSIAKKFKFGSSSFFGENAGLDLKFNFFNVFNNLNLAPINSLTDQTRVQSNRFGTPIAGLAGRVGEVQIRFSF